MSIDKIDDLLREGHKRFTPLQRLLDKAANQKRWTAEFRALLDPKLAHDVEVTSVQSDTLQVVCRHAAAATRLRFLLPDLTPRLRELQAFSHVRNVTVRISNQP